MNRSEVYSWRLSPALKGALEEASRREQKSVARLLEELAEDWLTRRSQPGDEAGEQERLRARALRFVGALRGGDPQRAERAREKVRARLAKRRHAGVPSA